MAEFVIKVADERGRTLQQFEHGYSEAEVRDRYTQQGFLVYSVKPRGLLAGGEVGLGRRRKIKPADFVIFNQQFLTLIHAGLPILNSLELLINARAILISVLFWKTFVTESRAASCSPTPSPNKESFPSCTRPP